MGALDWILFIIIIITLTTGPGAPVLLTPWHGTTTAGQKLPSIFGPRWRWLSWLWRHFSCATSRILSRVLPLLSLLRPTMPILGRFATTRSASSRLLHWWVEATIVWLKLYDLWLKDSVFLSPLFLGVATIFCLLPHVTAGACSIGFLWLDAHAACAHLRPTNID